MKKQIKLITCKALKHILEPLLDIQIEKVILEIGLHLNPDRLRDRLIEEVAMIEGEDVDIILGYGLCGRALEEIGTVITPGLGFGIGGEGWFRISLTASDEAISEGARRLEGWK